MRANDKIFPWAQSPNKSHLSGKISPAIASGSTLLLIGIGRKACTGEEFRRVRMWGPNELKAINLHDDGCFVALSDLGYGPDCRVRFKGDFRQTGRSVTEPRLVRVRDQSCWVRPILARRYRIVSRRESIRLERAVFCQSSSVSLFRDVGHRNPKVT